MSDSFFLFNSTRLQRRIPLTVMLSGHLAVSLLPPSLSRQPQKHVAFAMEANESESEKEPRRHSTLAALSEGRCTPE